MFQRHVAFTNLTLIITITLTPLIIFNPCSIVLKMSVMNKSGQYLVNNDEWPTESNQYSQMA